MGESALTRVGSEEDGSSDGLEKVKFGALLDVILVSDGESRS